MYRWFLAAAFAVAVTSAEARSVNFEGFGGLFFFDGANTVAIEERIFGNINTGIGSPFFEHIMSGPSARISFDLFGEPLASPLTCFGNNTIVRAGAENPACFTDTAHVNMNYALLIDDAASFTSLSIYASSSTDPFDFFLGSAGIIRSATAVPSVPIPGALVLMLAGLATLGALSALKQPTARSG